MVNQALGLLRAGLFIAALSGAAHAQASSTYQIDAAHTGSIVFEQGLRFPLQERWTVDLGESVSYPVIADGRVFVVTDRNGGASDVELVALDAETGSQLWKRACPGMSWAAHAYGDGRLYTLDASGTLSAINPGSGELLWSVAPGFSPAGYGLPIYSAGLVFFVGGANAATLFAVDAASGQEVWSRYFGDRPSGALSVRGHAVYANFGCNDHSKFAAKSGKTLWEHHFPRCDGGTNLTGPVSDAGLYSFDFYDDTLLFDRQTGEIRSALRAQTIPAVKGHRRFNLLGDELVMVDEISGQQIWAFAGDGQLSTAPIVVNNVVFAGSVSGSVYAVDATDGSLRWSGKVGSKIPHSNQRNIARPLIGMSAGEGMVAIPSVGRLTVFASRP
jgi:outer membrane protein assembly factor BamB